MKNKIGKIVIAWLLVVCMIAPLLPDFGLVLAADVAEDNNYDAMSMDEIFELDKSLTWVFAGDSITHNDRWTQGMNGYAEWFEQYLYDIGRNDDSVILSAWSGASISEFQPSSDGAIASDGKGLENMITKYNPDVVFIKMGMNDRDITTEEFTNYYKAMLDGIYAAGKAQEVPKIPKVVLLTPSPVSSENKYDDMHHTDPVAGANEVQDTTLHLQKAINAIWEEYDATYNPIFCDLRTAFLDEALVLGDDYHRTFFGDSSDGHLHPNAAGQYFIFKTLCEALDIDTTSEDIFKFSYDDINSGTVYVDGTSGVDYANDYADTNKNDAAEMDKDLVPKQLLASVDFSDEDGVLDKSKGIDLTTLSGKNDPLTVDEAKSMDKEYSVVFRAKLSSDTSTYSDWAQTIFYMGANKESRWNSAYNPSLAVLLPVKNNMFYSMYKNKQNQLIGTSSSNYLNTGVAGIGGGEWHTYAWVQSENELTFYIDGKSEIIQLNNSNYTLPENLGELMSSATAETFEAYIGSLGNKDDIYRTSGNYDYWQLYNGALTAEEVAELTNASGAVDDTTEMNKDMEELSDTTLTRLANADFDNSSGVLSTASSVDLKKLSGEKNDSLTLAEVQSIGYEYSVVFRANLATKTQKNSQAIFYMSANSGARWGHQTDQPAALVANIPGNKVMYYQMLHNGGTISNAAGDSTNSWANVTAFGAGEWHTYALVQTKDNLIVYVDGKSTIPERNSKVYKLSTEIGKAFTADGVTEDTFEAYIGSLGAGDDNYRVNGKFDYWQLYNGALTAENVMTLTDAAEMNCTMPTLSTALIQKVLASVQFKEDNCVLGGTENPYVDLTDANQVDDTLNLEEVKSMGTEYTIAFRAKLTDPSAASQTALFLGSDPNTNWWSQKADLVLTLPTGRTKTDGGYYKFNKDGKAVASVTGFINQALVEGSDTPETYKHKNDYGIDENWHTFVVVQSKDELTMYVDGIPYVLKSTGKSINTNGITIGSSFTDAFANYDSLEFEAYIGKLGAGEGTDYGIDGKLDYWTLYDGALTPEQVELIPGVFELDTKITDWGNTLTKNNVWAVAGAEQMSGYEGTVAERSLFRLLDSTMRYEPHGRTNYHTDIRMINASAPGYTVSTIAEQQNTIISNYSPNVYMLLPEVSEVYDTANYSDADHTTKVTTYADTINSIVDANQAAGITTILWTPLASDNETINNYLADYADAVRKIVQENNDVLFFDAYRFMNENMVNEVLKRNWFGNDSYISPLCALDLTYAFYTAMDETSILTNELTDHNLRFSSDKRVFGGDYAYDNISASADVVTGTQNVAIDVSNIDAVYSGATIQITWAAGDGTEEILEATQNGNTYTVAAPCDNPVFAVYGTLNGAKYRFNNVEVAITGVTTVAEPTEAKLETLEVVGAPALEFNADTTSYDVQLYQYQKHVQVLATAQEGLKITVNGEPVASGENSGLIDVTAAPSADSDEESLKITVDVTIDGSETKTTYTLNLTRELNPDIIITEVMQDGYNKYTTGSGNDNYELIEIYNASGRILNLLDYSIGYKQDNPESGQDVNKGEWPYYFTGNDQAFSGAQATYTGINEITQYSTYDEAGSATTVDSIDFLPNSTMVIWIKFPPRDVSAEAAETYMDSLTYNSLVDALSTEASNGYTLTVDGNPVIPAEDQLVIAEIPRGTATAAVGDNYRVKTIAEDVPDNYYMDNHKTNKRSWLFVLDKEATQGENGSITNEGNNIISASKFARIGNTDKLSSVFSYNTERGMSLVKNEGEWNPDTIGTPHTSDQQGYSNATTFGAIEYWQKPVNAKDTEQPVVLSTIDFENKADATANFTISDDTDIRYVEFYARKTGEETWTEVIKKDIVFEECIANTGVTTDKTSYTFSFGLELAEDSTDSVEYYGLLVDGSGNVIEIGSEAEPVDSCKYELVKYTAEEVKGFIDGDESSYPAEVAGYLFAGWYKNEEHKNIQNAIVTSADVPEDGAYALYIPEHVLSVQAQLSTNLLDNDLSDDETGAIRFVTSVDSLNYNDAGFDFTFAGNEEVFKRSNKKVHDYLYGLRQGKIAKEDLLEKYAPSTSFCARSSYFKTHAWVNIAQSRFDLDITATPFLETLDGKIVRGEPVTKCINDGRGSEWTYVSAETGSDETGDGSEENPYETLEHGFEHVEDKGVIYVVGEYQLASDFKWPTSGKFVTITGDTLNCKAIAKGKSLDIKSAVRFDGITLQFTDGMWIWANGNEVTIAENVTVEGTPEYLFGGGFGTTVESTDLTVLAGNYQKIFGGGYGKNNVVENDTYLHVGGNVNADLVDNSERLIYGGGFMGTVQGNTKVIVDGEVNVNESKTWENVNADLYGGARNGTVSGNTDVTVKGNAIFRGIYGGGHNAKASDGTPIVSGNTNILVDGYVNNTLKLDETGWGVEGAILYGGGNGCAITGSTTVTVQGNAQFTHIHGGGYNSVVGVNTNVTVQGTVNAHDTNLANSWILGGGYGTTASADVNGTATVEVKGQARSMYIFGAGRASGATANVNKTNVTVSENIALNSIYGGGFYGGSGDTNVTVLGGTINILVGAGFGIDMAGNTQILVSGGTINEVYGGSDSANVTGNTEVAVLGGKIVEQVYGGCKNEDKKLATSPYSVTGHTSVKIGPGADLAISARDKAVYAVSRSSANAADEKGVFIINDYRNNANKFVAGSNANTTVSAIKSHHYFVNVSSGGDVSVQGDGVLAIKPDAGFKAIVKSVDGTVLGTYDADATYQLPTYEDEEIVLYVEFTKITSEIIYLSENGSDETGDGSKENPYQTLNCAIDKADNGDTISVIDTYTVDSDESWVAHGKAVTITSTDENSILDFSNLETVNIHDAVAFSDLKINFKEGWLNSKNKTVYPTVYANGYNLTIDDDVTFENAGCINVFAGANSDTVMNTNVTLLAGDYNKIYGGGNTGTVLGDTRLHIAGTVNETRTIASDNAAVIYGAGYASSSVVEGNTNVYLGGNANSPTSTHHSGAVVYGAGEYGTVQGDTNVTIEGNVNVNRVYGGGYDGSTGGSTHVTVSGDVNSKLSWTGNYSDNYLGAHLYGGGYIDNIAGDTYVTVKGNAKFNEIYGGSRGYNNNSTSAVIEGNTNVNVGGDVNKGLSFAAVGFADVFAGSRMGTVNGTTKVSVTDNANFYHIYGGGREAASVCGDTTVIVDGNVNAALTVDNDTQISHSKIATVYGGSNAGTVGNTNVTIGGSARFNYVYGAGHSGTAQTTTVKFNGEGATAYSIYGGSQSATTDVNPNTSTFIEMTAGWVAQVFGGCEGATMKGDTNVRILGGTVTRRIYGGCYNNCKNVGTVLPDYEWDETDYHVVGCASVTIGSGATISLNEESDNGLFATSRYETNNAEEVGIFILNNCNVSQFGQKDTATSMVMTQGNSHHHLVNVSAGGNVYVVDGALKVVPDEGHTLASITYSDGTTPTTDGNGNYILPTKTDSVKTITVTFN